MTFLGLSILTSASFYMIFDNFNVSVILMGYIGFHKLDHLCIAKSCKVCVNGFYLYPFWGGVAFIEYPDQQIKKFLILLGGPVFSLMFTMAVYVSKNIPASVLYKPTEPALSSSYCQL